MLLGLALFRRKNGDIKKARFHEYVLLILDLVTVVFYATLHYCYNLLWLFLFVRVFLLRCK